VLHELLGQPWEEHLENLLSAGEQGVDVARLWRAASLLGAGCEIVAVDDGDLAVSVGENARGQQAGHASAQHDCVIVGHGGSVGRRGTR
jgi:hypothetical protein